MDFFSTNGSLCLPLFDRAFGCPWILRVHPRKMRSSRFVFRSKLLPIIARAGWEDAVEL